MYFGGYLKAIETSEDISIQELAVESNVGIRNVDGQIQDVNPTDADISDQERQDINRIHSNIKEINNAVLYKINLIKSYSEEDDTILWSYVANDLNTITSEAEFEALDYISLYYDANHH